MEYRKIIHVDMDAFYASVEQRDHPEYRGKPVAVGHADKRGVVATASYEARAFGVHSAMPSKRAKELCPQLIFVEGRMEHYRDVSRQIRSIFERYTDLIEPISIDEAFLDVTDNKRGIPLAVDVARHIKRAIREELNLIASAGVSYNKFLAKVASDWRKPDGLCTIHPDEALKFIDTLKVEHLWGVGPATAKKMHEMGLVTAADVRALSLSTLQEVFGKAGLTYYEFVRGIDRRRVTPVRERKSVGCEETYTEDLVNSEEISGALAAVAGELVRRLTKARFRGTTLTVKVRFADFRTISRSVSRKTSWGTEADILSAAEMLVREALHPGDAVRLLGITIGNPVTAPEEPDLFDTVLSL